jgi:hypothetical protein
MAYLIMLLQEYLDAIYELCHDLLCLYKTKSLYV